MSVKQISFRVDGDAEIGLGHLVRCMALAQMLQNNFSIKFVCKKIPSSIVEELNQIGFGLQRIEDESDFFNCLNGEEIVVVDHYGLGTQYQREIKAKGCKLVCVDDMHDKVFFADLIINHAPGVKFSDYEVQPYTRFALGLDYVLLRPIFLKKAASTLHKRSIKNAFICFGGSDPKNITQVVVDILKNDERFERIIVVTGAAYKNMDALELSVEQDKRFMIYHAISASEMCDLISQVELAIVPSSGILQEVISQNVKVISGMYVKNQKFIFENYRQIHAFESAEHFQPDKIRDAIDACFKNRTYNSDSHLIDGKSGDRLLEIFKSF